MKQAPTFSLPDQDGLVHDLEDYAGKWLVLFFYPKDRTINCTREACSFRDERMIIAQFGNAEIVGINDGSIASHKQFADENHLNFPLLSDPDHKVTEAYGAWRTGKFALVDRMYNTRRNTYIINPEGKIVKIYRGVSVKNHVEKVIQDLQKLQNM
jgi:peroxiredoxin Q/BCP